MKEYIYVVETIEASEGKAEELGRELLKIVPLSREEEGCIYYDLYRDRKHPDSYVVLMCWKNRVCYEAHNNAEFIQEFVTKFDPALYRNVIENLYEKLSK